MSQGWSNHDTSRGKCFVMFMNNNVFVSFITHEHFDRCRFPFVGRMVPTIIEIYAWFTKVSESESTRWVRFSVVGESSAVDGLWFVRQRRISFVIELANDWTMSLRKLCCSPDVCVVWINGETSGKLIWIGKRNYAMLFRKTFTKVKVFSGVKFERDFCHAIVISEDVNWLISLVLKNDKLMSVGPGDVRNAINNVNCVCNVVI